MSRIQQILSKAERDGTARRLVLTGQPEEEAAREAELSTAPAGWRIAPAPPTDRPDVWAADSDLALDTVTDLTPQLPARPVFGAKLHRLLVAARDASSPAAEHYRSLRTRIAQAEAGSVRRVIVVTSPGMADGKTVTAANLALTMAQEFQRRVLLIDADLRHARLHALLGIAREPGLADVLTGAAPLEDALVSLPELRLMVLPAGRAHAQPTELLSSGPMVQLVAALRRRFDRVLIDSAAAHLADAGVVEPLADGVLLIVRAGHTPKPAIERALSVLPAPKLLGLVLNESRGTGRSHGFRTA